MLKVSIAYIGEGRREMPLIESLDRETIRVTAKRILSEYAQGAVHCPDGVLATLLREERRQAISVLRAAGMDLEGEP